MKIIKIELQNINSLKSETPIVIDFESEQFRDVGLYAITGSTGAGKTTILDAVTIALYHEVPRFNRSNVKAGLEDVVSYGANDALSRVTFENKGERFEAQWNMRLATKTGKKLGKPKEEVRLKNLTSGKIIAEKKREVQSEIERVTQLDYNQFLRSVLLAQGEFASFLSAKTKDKGTLLEQITGEEIYKKIGEAIHQRLSEEREKLKGIKAKLNNEDLLTSDQRKELKIEQEAIGLSIQELNKKLDAIGKVTRWYKTTADLLKQKELLQRQIIKLQENKKEKATILTALQLNEKAEPFKEILGSIKRGEKDIGNKKIVSKKLADELDILDPQIELADKEKMASQNNVQQKEADFKNWLPKLEEVSQLDAGIKNKTLSKKKADDALNETTNSIASLETEIAKLKIVHADKKSELSAIQSFLNEHKNIPEIEKRFNGWNSSLTLLKSKKESIENDVKFCADKELELTETNRNIDKTNLIVSKENKELAVVEDELTAISKQLSENKLEQLLKEKEKADELRTAWKTLLNLMVTQQNLTNQKEKIINERAAKLTLKIELEKQLNHLFSEMEKAKTTVADAEKIVKLEHTIKSFEEERSKLKKGKPCALCGATEHPFVEKYKTLETSEAETELRKRKEEVDKLLKESGKTEKEITKITVETDIFSTRIIEIDAELENITEQINTLNIDESISEIKQINKTLLLLDKEVKRMGLAISAAQDNQTQKDKKEKIVNTKKQEINKLTTTVATLIEKKKNINLQLKERRNQLRHTRNVAAKIVDTLNPDFSKFGLEVPEAKYTSLFISQLESVISDYNSKNKLKTEIDGKISEFELIIKNLHSQLSGKLKVLQKETDEQKEIEQSLFDLKKARVKILPLETTTEMKRSELQNLINVAIKKFNLIDKKLLDLKTKKTANTTNTNSIEADLRVAKEKLKTDFLTLEKQISESNFSSKEEIEQALLSDQKKKMFSTIKKQIDEKNIELKTLETKLDKDFKKQETQKDFKISEVEALEEEATLAEEKEDNLKKSGKISQQFALDNQIKERNKSVFEEIEQQERQVNKWKGLIDLLGGSKDAFNTYVQRLTLQNLIALANIHLLKLNKRYSLKMNETYKTGEELNFNLIDHYQTNEARYIDTSSGGEKFIISLALALGLSDLASNNVNIDSLFIDEGFGTLDSNTLETVISTLETLQAEGKMIGIISHVENLKERIPTQVQVVKKSNGVSRVEII